MDGKLLARLGAIVFVAFALTATAIEMVRWDDEPALPPRQHDRTSPNDPLRAGQRRCQGLGEAAARDSECLRIWAQTRERFLGAAAPARSNEER
jgi:conjugative transfer region protein TrbK